MGWCELDVCIVDQFIEGARHGNWCLDLMLIHTMLEVPNHMEEFQEVVKSLEVNPMELDGVKY